MGQSSDVNLDSFLDIMTCLVGCLVLILILTSIDASQVKVLIPTPMEHETDKRPIYIECRDNELFRVPVMELRKLSNEKLNEMAVEADGDTGKMLRLMSETPVRGEQYTVDLEFSLVGQFAVEPISGIKGYRLIDMNSEKQSDWFGRILKDMNKESEMLSFLVRDDSFEVFKQARALAWLDKAEVSYELLDVQDTIKFGLGGAVPLAQ